MKQDEEETIVIFRTFRDTGEVIALFPDLDHEADATKYGHVMSYTHVGQHGEADYVHVISMTKPATELEYQDLHEELEGIGYLLRVLKKKPIGSRP